VKLVSKSSVKRRSADIGAKKDELKSSNEPIFNSLIHYCPVKHLRALKAVV